MAGEIAGTMPCRECGEPMMVDIDDKGNVIGWPIRCQLCLPQIELPQWVTVRDTRVRDHVDPPTTAE